MRLNVLRNKTGPGLGLDGPQFRIYTPRQAVGKARSIISSYDKQGEKKNYVPGDVLAPVQTANGVKERERHLEDLTWT